jgi:hypothetical protein
MKYFQEYVQLLGKLDGVELRSENTQYMMVPQDLTIYCSAWNKI